MKKIILLVICSLSLSFAVGSNITWQGDESALFSTAGNWNGGVVPTQLDTATFDNTASGNCSLDVAVSLLMFNSTATFTYNIATNPAVACTVSGNFLIDAASTADTMKLKSTIVMDGGAGTKIAFETGPTYQFSATTTNIIATCDSLVNRTPAIITINKIDKGSTKLIFGGTKSFAVTQCFFGSDTTVFTGATAGFVWVYPKTSTDFTYNASAVLNTGETDFAIYPQVAGTYTIPYLYTIGMNSLVIQNQKVGVAITVSMGGNIFTGHNLVYQKSQTGKYTVHTNGYSMICNLPLEGYFSMDNKVATDTVFSNLYGSTITYKYLYANFQDGDGILVVNADSSHINIGQDMQMANANLIWNPGKSIITLTGKSSVSTAQLLYFGTHTIYDLIIASSDSPYTKAVTFMDGLICHNLTLDSGNVNQNLIPFYVSGNYINNLTAVGDTAKMSALLYIGGNFTRIPGAKASRTAGVIQFSDTGTHTMTANGTQLGPVQFKTLTILDHVHLQKSTMTRGGKLSIANGIEVVMDSVGNFNQDTAQSNTAGQRAQLTLPVNTAPDTMWAKDIYSTNKLWDTTITGLNLGNNANIVFKDALNQRYLADSTVVVVTSASPASIVLAGRVDTIRGTGFYSPCSVSVTGIGYVIATVIDSTLLYFTAGATTAGLKTVTVKNADGKVRSANALTYLDLPIISYGGPHIDTVGKAASHAVTSTGGTVASYALTTGTLVSTMALNTTTGLISGTPGTTKGATVYRITATNATGTGYYDWTESVISGTVPKVALGHLRIVPTSGDTAGGTAILFYADTLMTGSTCGEVDSYTVLTDSTASGTSKVGTVGDFSIVVHSGSVDSTVVFRYTAGGSKKKTSGKFSFKIRFPIFPPSGNSN